MQKRHQDRKQYFIELANTARNFYIDYLNQQRKLTGTERVLEIGCGEGGNLLPFSELGCTVYGLDIDTAKIENAEKFYAEFNTKGSPAKFECLDFTTAKKPESEEERYDIILIHDVIEHIEPPYKKSFFENAKCYLKKDGLLFFAFPVWQMPYGGHQQICSSKLSSFPTPATYLSLQMDSDQMRRTGRPYKRTAQHSAFTNDARTVQTSVKRNRVRNLRRTLLVHQSTLQAKIWTEPTQNVEMVCQHSIRNFATTSFWALVKIR